jgi:hypothetical protein
MRLIVMDTELVLADLLRALKARDWDELCDCLDALLHWMHRGGPIKHLVPIDLPEPPMPIKVFALITKYNEVLGQLQEKVDP